MTPNTKNILIVLVGLIVVLGSVLAYKSATHVTPVVVAPIVDVEQGPAAEIKKDINEVKIDAFDEEFNDIEKDINSL
ncbi:hypothetical protein K9M47_01000 [Candidatus Gracilibacteria bacterium]|nr:hypothetical protein [Candidatus Gracilibacteria bacterium]MCF7898546.1 hypothetical protein [Candidatus Paceibacterota bacterium]